MAAASALGVPAFLRAQDTTIKVGHMTKRVRVGHPEAFRVCGAAAGGAFPQ